MRIGYLECFSGIGGDMFLGALVDAGVPFSLLEQTAASLNVGAQLEARKVMRGGLTGTKIDVIAPDEQSFEHGHSHEAHSHDPSRDRVHHAHAESEAQSHTESGAPSIRRFLPDGWETTNLDALSFPRSSAERVGEHESHSHHREHAHAPHRSLSTILAIIAAAPLPERVKARSTRAFQLLGEAEAAIHSIPIEKVHFHEVGAVDTIVDIVCAAAGCESLAIDRWVASPLNVGSGTVQCAHGTLPVPAPATLALIGGAPIYASGSPMERVTPTGAAILRMLEVRYASLPAMRVQSSGYGAGGRDLPGEPNLLRLLIGEQPESEPESAEVESAEVEPIAVLVAVIDDSTPQLIAYAAELLREAGAWDVYHSAVQMKKGRTGVEIAVLSSPSRLPALRDILLRETTTIGLRWSIEQKLALHRAFVEVETEWGKVRIKVARWPSGRVANASPEYEHCRAIALRRDVPLKQVMQAAMLAYAATESAHPQRSQSQEANPQRTNRNDPVAD